MFYALVYYPELKSEFIKQLRHQYDPYKDLIQEHITLVYPVPESIGEENIIKHINQVIKEWEPFKIHIKGYEKTWDNWLFLKIREGKEKLITLHDELYKGILQLYLRKDIPYKPHIGLGLFTKNTYDPLHPEKLPFDEENYQIAAAELEKLQPEFWRIMNQLTLVKINVEFSKLWDVETFYLF
jgi:2'-5' RNA ligase